MNYDNPSPAFEDFSQRRRRNQQPAYQQQRQQGIDVVVRNLGSELRRRTITPSTRIEGLASGFGESSQDVYFVHDGKILTDQSLQQVTRGSIIEMKRGFDAWLKKLNGSYILLKITPSLTIDQLANWLHVSPGEVDFHHQGYILTNRTLQQVRKGGSIGMLLKRGYRSLNGGMFVGNITR